MRIAAFEKFTTLDYPGKFAAVVFTPGCVFRCPFCHNPELVEPKDDDSKALFLANREEEFFAFLAKRKGKLDGVCITGGEPTLHTDLLAFIERVKQEGFLVKLDTNGVFPDIVEQILDSELVDMWAMDIKHTKEKYAIASGVPVDMENISRSVELLMQKAKSYEFRTTVVPGIHEDADFDEIARWISGAQAYYLQAFRDIKLLRPETVDSARETSLNLPVIAQRIGKHFRHIEVRS
jgi:pyruvate formate lyase activating enzyme